MLVHETTVEQRRYGLGITLYDARCTCGWHVGDQPWKETALRIAAAHVTAFQAQGLGPRIVQ